MKNQLHRKKSVLCGNLLGAAIAISLIVPTGCKREKGNYDSKPVVNTSSLTAYDYLKSKPGLYDSLLLVVDKMGYAETLKDSSVTVFAPQNVSFSLALSNLNQIRATVGEEPIYLSQLAAGGDNITNIKAKNQANRNKQQLDTLISMYIIRKQFVSNDFAIGDGQMVVATHTAYPMHAQRVFADAQGFVGGGSAVIEYADTRRSLFISKWAKSLTSSVDIKTKNAIVNLLSTDHKFGFDDFVSRMTYLPPPPLAYDVKTDTLFATWPSASGYTDGQVSPGEVFKNALDNTVLTKFISNVNAQNNWYPTMWWIPDTPKIANSYTMTTANDSKTNRDRDPRAFRLEATNSDNPSKNPDAVWVTLDTRQDQDWTTNYQQKEFDFNNTVAYKAYRLIILQVGTGTSSQGLFQISGWTMNYQDPDQ